MKKVILLFLITAVMFSCKKNETTTPDVTQQAEIAFNISTILPDVNREWDYDVPECNPDAFATQAKFKIEGLEGDADPGDGYYYVDVYYTNDSLYSKGVKVNLTTDCTPDVNDCCTFELLEFYLLDQDGHVMKAMPMFTSEFYEFVSNPNPIFIEVCAFMKTQVYVDVLCFEEHLYQLFGFFWFNITEITVREMCFFGDICISYFVDTPYYVDFEAWQVAAGYNHYQNQTYGIQADMPCIFTLKVFKWEGGLYPDFGDWSINSRDWNNEYYPTDPPTPWWGEDDPLCIKYADYDFATDVYKIELWVYGPFSGFGYQYVGEWIFTDDAQTLDTNQDGVVDFVLGTCNENPEYTF